jgi:hypothetical protein
MFSHILTVVKYITYKVKHLDIKLSANKRKSLIFFYKALVTDLVEKVLPEFKENVFNTAKKDYFNNVVEAWLILANQGIKEDKYLIKVVVALIN